MKSRYEITYERTAKNGSKIVLHIGEWAESVAEAKALFRSKNIDGQGGVAKYKIISCVKK